MTAPTPPAPADWDDDDLDPDANDVDGDEDPDGLEDDLDGDIVDAQVDAAPPEPPVAANRRKALVHPRKVAADVGQWAYDNEVAYHAARFWWKYWAILAFCSWFTVARARRWAWEFILDRPGVTLDYRIAQELGKANPAKHGKVVTARFVMWAARLVRLGIVAFPAIVIWGLVAQRVLEAPLVEQVAVGYLVLPFAGWWSRPIADEHGEGGLAKRRSRAIDQIPFTADRIVDALAELGIPKLAKAIRETEGRAVQFIGEIERTKADTGWTVDIILPGIPAEAIVRRRRELATNLGRPESCVFPSAVPDEPANLLHLFVARVAPSKREPAPWPYLLKGLVNFFEPVVIGEDQQGEPLKVTFAENLSILLGAIPGAGKTWLQRLLALCCALDPRVELHVWNFKGGSGWSAFRRIAHAYGASPRMADIAPKMLADFKRITAELGRRYDLLEDLYDRFKTGTITDEMASIRELGLHPICIFIDEYHYAFLDPKWGPLFQAYVEDFVRRGRECLIFICLSTQKPSARSTPTDLRDNIVLKIAMRLTSRTATDMVLGAAAWAERRRTNRFSRKSRMMLVVGEDDTPITGKVSTVTDAQVEAVVTRIEKYKRQRGYLTGFAAGQDLEPDNETTVSLMEHLIQVWPVDRASERTDKRKRRITTSQAVELLQGTDPKRYEGWTPAQLTSNLTKFELSTDLKHVDSLVGTQRSIDYEELLDALDRWTARQAAEAAAADAEATAESRRVDDDDEQQVLDKWSDDDDADDTKQVA